MITFLVTGDSYFWQGPANFTNGIGRKYFVTINKIDTSPYDFYKKGQTFQLAWSIFTGNNTDSYSSDMTTKGA